MKRIVLVFLFLVIGLLVCFYLFKLQPDQKVTQNVPKLNEQEQTTTQEKNADKQPPKKIPSNKTLSKNKTMQEYQRQDLNFLKFVSSENCLYFLDKQEIEKLRALNINGIRICPLYRISQNGILEEEMPEFFIIDLIHKAHDAGFAVFLEINAGGKPTETGEPEFRYKSLEDINKLYNIAHYWAKIAEKENVEFFSPLNEPNLMFTDENLVNLWINRTKDLAQVFSGKLVLKFADIGPETIENIQHYDYLAFDIMWGDDEFNELKTHLELAVKKGNYLKKKFNLKGFFFGELGAERSMVDEPTQAKIFKTILETTWDEVDGYCFLGWSNLEFRFKDNDEAVNIIKKWYTKRN